MGYRRKSALIGSGDDTYQRMQKLGEGTYGVVYKGLHISSQHTVALKKVRLLHREMEAEVDVRGGAEYECARAGSHRQNAHAQSAEEGFCEAGTETSLFSRTAILSAY